MHQTSKEGIEKMLHNNKPDKAAGRVEGVERWNSSYTGAYILQIYPKRHCAQWLENYQYCFIIFKKGDKHKASNYRPVSLTCILGKYMEHIIVSSISTHLDTNKISNPLQHGFRKSLSCDSHICNYSHYSTT